MGRLYLYLVPYKRFKISILFLGIPQVKVSPGLIFLLTFIPVSESPYVSLITVYKDKIQR